MTNDEKRAIIEAATPGPWHTNCIWGDTIHDLEDAEFIAAARNEWPKDLEQLEAMKELLRDLQWGGGADGRCQYCGEDVCDGHTRDCRIAALLREG